MEQSPSNFEETIQHKFDRICRLAMKGERADYYRHLEYIRKHEKLFSELSDDEWHAVFSMDEYSVENHNFQVLGYDVEVKDALIAEALQELTEKKRNVVLLSYFMEMSDAEIARKMNLVRSTVNEHRKRSLEIMKDIMEANKDEEKC